MLLKLNGSTGRLRTPDDETGMWTVSFEFSDLDRIATIEERYVLVIPISRTSSDQSTATWSYASEGLTDRRRGSRHQTPRLRLKLPTCNLSRNDVR